MDFDPIFHQPVRTKIVSLLLREGECDYNFIKKAADITDGHMSTHMKALLEAEYVEVRKEFVKNKPRTTYRMSTKGKKSFKAYVDQLSEVIRISKNNG